MVMVDINEIRKLLPHSYPFLLVDRIIELESGEKNCRDKKRYLQ